ncbi:hypothetical protein KA005_59260, partial [bacterium]|nr:hypothetical protein [bacterium]
QTKIKDNFFSSIIREEKETPLLPAIGRAAATIPLHIGRAAAGVVQRGAQYAEAERAEIRGALKTVRGVEPIKPEKERKPLVTDEGFGTLLLDLMGKGVEKVGVGVEAIKEAAPVKAYGKFRAKGRLAEAVLNKEVKPEVEQLVRKGDKESLTKASALLESEEGFISKTVAEKYLAEPIAGVAAAIGKELGAKAEAIRPVTRRGSYKYYVTSAIEGVGATMIPAVTATLITKKPGVGLAIMFPQVFGESYSEERARGKDVVESTQKSLFSAATEVLSEAIPLGILTRVGGKLTKRVFKGAAAEGIQEAVNEAAQIAYDEGIINEYTPAREIGRRLLDAGIIGAIGGGGMAVVAHSFTGKEEEATEDLKKDILDSITETYDRGDQNADQTINSIKEGYKGGLFSDAALDELSKKYPELKDGIETIKEIAKEEVVRDTLTDAIDTGLTTGEFRGETFTPDTAINFIRNGLVNDIFTTEDVDGFKTRYPQLRSGLNELLAVQVGAGIAVPTIEPPAVARPVPRKEEVYADEDLEAIYVKAKERARTEPLTLHELQERFRERKKREITEIEKEKIKRIFERTKKFIRKERKIAALPPGQQFELVEPAPEVRLRPSPEKIEGPVYPEGVEYVAGKPAPEKLPVEYKPILTAKGTPWVNERSAVTALKTQRRLKDVGVTEKTHKVVPVEGGFQIVKKTDTE